MKSLFTIQTYPIEKLATGIAMETGCMVLRRNDFGLHDRIGDNRGVSLHCFVGNRYFFALITHEAAENRYHRKNLSRDHASGLVEGDLELQKLIIEMYQNGEGETYRQCHGINYPLVLVTSEDIKRLAPLAKLPPGIRVGEGGLAFAPHHGTGQSP